MNYLALLAAAVVAFIAGWLWYGPLFGKEWRRLMGFPEGAMGSPAGMKPVNAMVINFVAMLVMVYVLAGLFSALLVAEIGTAVVLAFWLWLGFIATVVLNSVLFEGRPWKLYFLNAGFQLVALVLAAIVLTAWTW